MSVATENSSNMEVDCWGRGLLSEAPPVAPPETTAARLTEQHAERSVGDRQKHLVT